MTGVEGIPGLAVRDGPLTDYGRVHRARGGWLELALSGVDPARELLALANRRRIPLRVRGAGHSMNGVSVPRPGEILVTTGGCRHFRFTRELTVTVGAGAAVWDVDRMLHAHGFELLLCNDGGAPAATVGGFVSAGGIGAETWLHGGFWETVAEVVLLTGAGELVRCGPADPLFPWLFGSMGQLGLIVEATLRIRRRDDAPSARYPRGMEGEMGGGRAPWEPNAWLTLFVPEEAWERAREQMGELGLKHRAVWTPRDDYLYFVRFQTFNPPLLYPRAESFVALGIWGTTPEVLTPADVAGLRALERDFAGLVASQPAWRRYIQSELTFEDTDFAAYFGEEVIRGFSEVKRACDPNLLLGQGLVFR